MASAPPATISAPTDRAVAWSGERRALARWASPARCVWLGLLLPWTLWGSVVLWQGWQYVGAAYPTCQTEILIVDGLEAVTQGRTLYHHLDNGPLVARIYNVLAYFPAGWGARLLGLERDALWQAGRVIPYASTFLLLGALAAYVRRQTGRRDAAWLAVSLTLFLHTSTLTDFFRNRPDTPALALALCGWTVAQIRPRHWPLWSAGLCALALAHKQSALAAPAAIALQLTIAREWRALGVFTATGLAGGALCVMAGFLLGGPGYWEHVVSAMAANPVEPWQAAGYFYPILICRHWGWFALPLALAACWVARQPALGGLRIYLLVTLVWTSYAHGKAGADLNYHAELSLLLVLCLALAWGMAAKASDAAERRWQWLLVVSLLWATWSPTLRDGRLGVDVSPNRIAPGARDFEPSRRPFGDIDQAVVHYSGLQGRLLSFNEELAWRVGEPVLLDWYAVKLMLNAGTVPAERLLGPISSRHYQAIVLPIGADDPWLRRVRQSAAQAGYQAHTTETGLEEWSLIGTEPVG